MIERNFCGQCGHSIGIASDAQFCQYCGAPIPLTGIDNLNQGEGTSESHKMRPLYGTPAPPIALFATPPSAPHLMPRRTKRMPRALSIVINIGAYLADLILARLRLRPTRYMRRKNLTQSHDMSLFKTSSLVVGLCCLDGHRQTRG